MNKLNEVVRMQQLAGINEIKIDNPLFNENEAKEYLNNLAWGI